MIQVIDILDFLVARSCAPSTMGAQLERIQYGISLTPDPFRQRDDVEDHLLHQAVLIRCIDEFSRRETFSVTTRQRKAADAGYKALTKIHESATDYPQGSLAIGILRAYHERSTQSQERGLVAVYQYLSSIAPEVIPAPTKNDLLESFRTGTAKRARNFACEAYADSLLALQNHVRVFNRKEKAKE